MSNQFRELLDYIEQVGDLNPDGSVAVPYDSTLSLFMGCLAPFEHHYTEIDTDGKRVADAWRVYEPKPGTPEYHAARCGKLSESIFMESKYWRRFTAEALRHLRLAAGDLRGDEPTDLITFAVACSQFNVSRPTLQRCIDSNKLRSYRPANATTSTPHKVSEREVAALYPRR